MVHGYFNTGNSCYLNASLQCLMNIDIFVSVLKNTIINLKGYSTDNLKRYEFLNLLYDMTKETNPVNLKQVLSEYSPLFKGNQQQDSHEALVTIINIIHKETKGLSSYKKRLTNETTLFEKLSNNCWEKYFTTFGYSFMDDLFSGQQVTIINCPCGENQYNFEVFNTLTVNVDPDHTNLSDSFKELFSTEVIHEYQCDKCRCKTSANKQTTVWNFPEILVVSLSRHNKAHSLKKLNCNYDIMDTISFFNERIGRVHYKLKVMTNHIGFSTNSGHYTSVVIDNNNYYYIDDDKITQVAPFSKSAIVYLFVYVRDRY